MKKPGKLRKEQLEHPNDSTYVAWNGDVRKKRNKDRWNGAPDMEDTGFTSRGVTSSSGNHQPRKREVINGQLVWVDPMSTEVTGRVPQKPPSSVFVSGHERGRHEPQDNGPTHHRVGGQRSDG